MSGKIAPRHIDRIKIEELRLTVKVFQLIYWIFLVLSLFVPRPVSGGLLILTILSGIFWIVNGFRLERLLNAR